MKDDFRDIDLTTFDQANAQAKKGAKLTWDKRVTLVVDNFPISLVLEWRNAFDRDPDMFAWLMQDILRVDGAVPGRSGPKPNVDVRWAAGRLRRMIGDDYTCLPFDEAFRILARTRSMTNLARRTGISRSQVHRLHRGECEPTRAEVEAVAAAFDKNPGYFAEYRLSACVTAIFERLGDNPEATVKYYRHLAANREAAA